VITTITYKEKGYNIDLNNPLDISIPLKSGRPEPNCFYAPLYEAKPLKAGDFIGSTKAGSPVNFFNIKINPHGNGTHTECVGHISKEEYRLRDCLKSFHCMAYVFSVLPTLLENGDRLIMRRSLEMLIDPSLDLPEAFIVRTLPNDLEKMQRNYSGTNPCYFEPSAIEFLNHRGVNHLLTDLPSVDREEDQGALLSHKAFWNYPKKMLKHKTITELIFVKEEIEDGLYFLNIMVGNYDIDVSPSRPILYRLNEL